MTQSRWLRLVVVVLAMALLAVACGDDDDSSAPDPTDPVQPEPTDPEQPEPTEPEQPEPTDPGGEGAKVDTALGNVDVDKTAANCATAIELEVGEYNPGQPLNVANSVILGSGLNPHNDQAPASFAFYGWVFEGLVRQDVDGQIVPWLAKCWEVNDAGDVVTFFLHDGVTFHDGTPFDSEAVKANIEFVKTAGPPQVLPPVANQLGVVDSVEAVDDLTVKFNLTGPGEALLLSGLIRNSGFMVAPGVLGDAGANPVGTAPYAVQSMNADNSEFTLVAYEDYWQPQLVGAESVTITTVRDAQARADGLNAGQFDVAVINTNQQNDVPASSANTTVRIGFVVADWTGQTIPALANRDVRCAMAQALNRVGIQEAFGSPAETAINQFAVGPNDYAYIDDLDVPDFDLDAAKEAFAATGEEGFTFQNGHLPANFWPVVSSAWSGALAELGITMDNEALDPPSGGEMFARLSKGQYPVQIVAYNEPNALMSLIARTGEAAFNPSGVSPDGVAELVKSARSKSFEDGEADVADAWKIMLEECIFIIQQVLNTAVGHQTNVTGVHHTQGVPISFWPHGVRKEG